MLNKTWVFRCSRTDHAKQVSQYILASTGYWLTMLAVVKFALSTVTPNILIAKLFAVPPATLVGFVLMRFFVFQKPHRSLSLSL
jgi:putative flippase GtrA